MVDTIMTLASRSHVIDNRQVVQRIQVLAVVELGANCHAPYAPDACLLLNADACKFQLQSASLKELLLLFFPSPRCGIF